MRSRRTRLLRNMPRVLRYSANRNTNERERGSEKKTRQPFSLIVLLKASRAALTRCESNRTTPSQQLNAGDEKTTLKYPTVGNFPCAKRPISDRQCYPHRRAQIRRRFFSLVFDLFSSRLPPLPSRILDAESEISETRTRPRIFVVRRRFACISLHARRFALARVTLPYIPLRATLALAFSLSLVRFYRRE